MPKRGIQTKKYILLLLVALLSIGTLGCARTAQMKEIPAEFADSTDNGQKPYAVLKESILPFVIELII